VYLDQVAEIVDGQKEADSLSRINGKPGLTLNILKVQDANIVEVGNNTKKAAAELAKAAPPT
jgi:multidrug efflux pump subunit AcrB